MANKFCPNCGNACIDTALFCPSCGAKLPEAATVPPTQEQPGYVPPQQPYQQYQQPNQSYQQPGYQPPNFGLPDGVDPRWPVRSKLAAGLLGILTGGLGIHKFYLGKIGLGVVYLLFCWTCIPSIIGLVEGIIYLTEDDYTFQIKNQVRITPHDGQF